MKFNLIFIVISIVMGAICYVSIENIWFSLIVLVISFLDGIFLIDRRLKKYNTRVTRYQDCFNFINNMVISLSINPSLIAAYESSIKMVGGDLELENEQLSDMDPMDKLDYLKHFFALKDFEVFLDLLKSWNENGGDILKITDYLLCQMREREEYISYSNSIQKSKTVEFVVLWAVCYAILVVLRFALTNYYKQICGQMIYQVCIFGFFIFSLISINIYVFRVCHIEIESVEYES